jgi:hypothetical protein
MYSYYLSSEAKEGLKKRKNSFKLYTLHPFLLIVGTVTKRIFALLLRKSERSGLFYYLKGALSVNST